MGRFMLAPYGALITKVIHEKHIYKEYIGVDSCAANLMRPAIYGAYHHITVLGKENDICDHVYDITGFLCENCDKFAIDRKLPEINIGDYLFIHDAGAHGYSMGYNYNGRLRSAEILLKEDGSFIKIRRAETPMDYFITFDEFPIFNNAHLVYGAFFCMVCLFLIMDKLIISDFVIKNKVINISIISIVIFLGCISVFNNVLDYILR